MNEDRARIRITIGDSELEVEGDQEFIERFDDTISVLLERLRRACESVSPRTHTGGGNATFSSSAASGASFGEQLHTLPKSATATDQILLAGRFAQNDGQDNTFSTGEANKLLLEQAVKVSNPSQCMKNNLVAKRVFKVGDRYRVAKSGDDHLATLIGR
jgi:uncharacterized protein YciI